MSLLKELNTFSNALVHEWFREHNSDLFRLKASNEYMSIGRAIDSINFNVTGLFLYQVLYYGGTIRIL